MSGAQNSTVTQKNEPNPQFMQAYTDVLNQAKGVAATPYSPYPGQQVAGFTPDQQAAFTGVESSKGIAQPYLDQAKSYYDAANKPFYDTVQNYEDPYTSSVVDATQAQFNNQNAQDRQRLAGSEVAKGAWGGDRSGIAAAELSNQQQLAQAPVIAGLRSTGYQNAQQAAEAQALIANQSASGIANLGNTALNANNSYLSSLMQVGGLQQQQAQNQLNVPLQQWQQKQAYPFQTTGWLSGIANGIGGQAGGTSTQTSSQNPSALSAVGGIGQAALGLNGLGAFNGLGAGLFGNAAGIGGLFGAAGTTLGGYGASALGAGSLAGLDLSLPELLPLLLAAKRGGAIMPQRRADGGGLDILSLLGGGILPQLLHGTGMEGGIANFALGGLGGQLFGHSKKPKTGDQDEDPSKSPFAFSRGGIAGNDNDYPTPQRATGTGGIRGYDDGGDVFGDDPYAVPTPTPRPHLVTDGPTMDAGGISPTMPSVTMPGSGRYVPDYTPPSAGGIAPSADAAELRKNAPWLALLTSGLGTLASGNIGKGGLEGVQLYADQLKQAEAIEEKQKEAADTGTYRKATLEQEGMRLSDAAMESQARLKAQDAAAQETVRAHKASEDAAAATLRESQRYHNMELGSDDSGAPALSGPVDPNSGSILAQTGISLPAFMTLTGQASKLPRDRASRKQAFKEAENFANKNGVDVSTFTSQYEAYNDTLKSNIMRNNQTKIMEGELEGTIANLKPVADAAGNGPARIANVAKLFAGQEFNDPVVNQYAFNLQQLRTELAGYSAATQGRTGGSITQQDYNEAERVIKDGLSAKGSDGLLKAVQQSTGKMNGVLQKNIRNSNKMVWDLFGVGDKYEKIHPEKPDQNGPQTVTTKAQFDALSSGTVYTGKDGKQYRKP